MMTIVGVFDSYDGAQIAASEIRQKDFKHDEISIIRREPDSNPELDFESRSASDSLSDGTIAGTAIGGVAGLVLGMGSIVVPGLGVLAAAGPVAGLLAGALTGGIAGSLIDLGIPEEASGKYENDIRQGKVLFTMPVDQETGGAVSQILRQCGASGVELHKSTS